MEKWLVRRVRAKWERGREGEIRGDRGKEGGREGGRERGREKKYLLTSVSFTNM